MGAGKFNVRAGPAMDYHPIQEGGGGGVEILLVASCYGNWGLRLRCVGPLACKQTCLA